MKKILFTLIFTLSYILGFSQHPTNLTSSNITSNTADLSWNNSMCSGNVNLKYKEVGGSWNPNITNVTSPYTLTNLLANTDYEWTVKCVGNSGWATSEIFTTLSACNLISSISITDATCDNTMNGGAALTISGGNIPYTFAWSNGNTTQNLSGVLADTFIVQITDNVGCTLSDTAIIGFVGVNSVSQTVSNFIPNPLTNYGVWSYDTLSLTNTGCDTRVRPEFVISCSAGNIQQGDFIISWKHPALPNAWPNIPYTIDANGNAYGYWSTTSNTIHDSTGLPISFGNSYTIPVRVKFLNPALYGTYTATWETFEVDNLGNKIQSLSPSSSVSLSLVNCSTFSIDSISSSNVSCNSGTNGSASVFSIANGSGSYSYLWSNGDTNASSTNLAAGTYSCIVTDNNWGCTDSVGFIITEPSAITASLTGTHITCNGANDGTLTAVAGGGSGSYKYTWTPNLGGNSYYSALGAGLYIVIISDILCQGATAATDSFSINQPSVLTIFSSSANNTSCDTVNCNGNITISLSGGTQPYSYSWTNGYTDSIRNDLCGATYTIDATDANSCITFTENIIIYDSSFMPSALVTGTNISCNGMNDGSASAMISTGAGSSGGNISTLTYCASSPASNGYANIELVRIIGDGDSIVNNTAGTCDTYEDYTSQYTSLTPGGTYSIDVNLGTCDVTGGTIDSAGIFIDWNIDGDFTDPGEMVGVFGGVVQSPTSHTISFIVPNGYYGATRMRVISQAQMNNSGFPDGPVSPCVVGDFGALGTYNQPWYGATEDYSIVIVGVVPATYLWSTGDTTNIISNLSAGTYYCEVTDTNNCSATDTIIITEPDLISTTELTTNVNCNGGSDGTVTLTISGGTSPYVSNWNAADTNNLSVGIYTYTITDNNNCTFSDSINISEPIALTNSYTSVNINCNGASTGNIDITPFGGISPYTFAWDNGATTEDLTNVSAGQYIVTITDANNCTFIDTITLTEPFFLYSSFTQTNVSCYGLNDGSATINIFGGVTDYILSWDTLTYPLLAGVSVFTTPVGVPAGIYPYMVTDNNGCIIYDTITITGPSQILSTPTITNVSCYGLSDGSTSLSISGGTPTYTEDWGINNPLALAAGTYNYIVSDANGCIFSDSVTITEPNPISNTDISTDVDCYGDSTGSIDVTVSGGTQPYTYSWTGPNGYTESTEDIFGLSAGQYNQTITDFNGCTYYNSVLISEPPSISITESTTNVSCFGLSDGTATLSISGGTPTYNEDWGSNNPSVLAVGTYNYIVSDANLCVDSGSVTITEPSVLSSIITPTDLTSCLITNGSVDLTVSGGSSPYTYLWNNNDTTEDLSNLPAGNYSVVITDENGCNDTNNTMVSQPSNGLSLSLSSPNYNGYNISCYNGNNGTIITTASGGLGTLSFVWDNGDTTQNLSNLSEGSYSVTMTDTVGCSLFDNITLNEPSELTSVYSTTNVSCFGLADGGAIVNFFGGATGVAIGDTNYILGWAGTPLPLYLPFPNTIFNTALLPSPYNAVPSGVYPYTVTDLNGCIIFDTITITEPSAISVSSATTNVSCNGLSDGTATLTLSGGTGTLTEDWGTNNPMALASGTYNYTVTDSNLCVESGSVTITEPSAISVSSATTNVSCNGLSDGTATLTISGGTGTLVEDWGTANPTQLSAGTYIYTITDANQCTYTNSETINEPSEIIIITDYVIDVSVYNGNDGSIYISSNGGVGNYTYNWSGPSGYSSVNEDIVGLYSGDYIITVTDATNCSQSDTIFVDQPPSLIVSVDAVINLLCFGECNGQINITANGGDSVYTYLWTGPNGFSSTDEDLDSLCAGTYELIVSDTTSSVYATIVVDQPTQLQIITNVDTALCYGGTAQASAFTYGGQNPYSTNWDNGSSSITTYLTAGIHYVNVMDSNGCSISDTINIIQNDSMSISTTNTDISCYGLIDGSITINVDSGGTAPFTYSDDNGQSFQSSNTFYNLGVGLYNFIVMDVNGCTNSVSRRITEPDELIVTLDSNSTNVSCNGECDGTAIAYISGGTGSNMSEDWGSLDPNNLCAGLVNVIITDSNACLAANSVIITEPNPVIVMITVNGTTLEATPGFLSYQWIDENGNNILGAISQSYTPTNAGEYAVQVMDYNGCIGESIKINFIIESVGDISSHLSVYPNPTNSWVTIETKVEVNSDIKILNIFGEVVKTIDYELFNDKFEKINISEFSKGIYIIQLINNQSIINHKIILQ